MPVQFIDRKERASELLIEIDAIHFNQDEPFIFTSGWASPVYIDCRKLISFPRQRREIIQLAAEEIDRSIGRERMTLVAGSASPSRPW